MKTTFVKQHLRLLILLMLAGSSLSGRAEDLDSSKKKEINQSFNASAGDQLNIENRYGNITVTHWEKNEVAIRVVIESKATNDSRAQEGLDRVQVELKKSGNTVFGITSMKNQTGWNNNTKLTVDYYISMPAKLSATLSQKYGNINLPERNEGRYVLEVKYGNIKAGNFTGSLVIDAAYSNIDINDVQDAVLDLAYSGSANFGNANTIRVDSKYSNMKFLNIGKVDIDDKYGKIKIKNVDNLSLEIKYGEVSIERVKEAISSSLDYSTLIVKELDAGFEKVNVEAHYGTFNLSVPSQAAFRLTAESMKYGKVTTGGLKVTSSNIDNKTHYYYQINGGGSRSIQFNGNNYSTLIINAL
jgi:hypothetical protein